MNDTIESLLTDVEMEIDHLRKATATGRNVPNIMLARVAVHVEKLRARLTRLVDAAEGIAQPVSRPKSDRKPA